MYAYTATIGRNISAAHPVRAHQPMSITEWENFKFAVVEDMRAASETSDYQDPFTLEVHAGIGHWEGRSEESVKVTLMRDKKLTDHAYAQLIGCLKFDAREYGQDAIALSVGESQLIEPDGPRDLPAMLIDGEKVGPATIR